VIGRRPLVIAVTALMLAIAGVVVALAVVAPRHGGRLGVMGDAHYAYAAALSLAEDGDVDIGDELAEIGDPWGFGRDRAADGVVLPVRELGPSLLMVPGISLGAALDVPRAQWPVLATLPTALSWAIAFLGIARALAGLGELAPAAAVRDRIALAATLGLPGAFYAVGYAGYAHGPDAAIGAWIVAGLVRGASARAVGLLVAGALLFRLQNALWLAWPACTAIAARGEARFPAMRRVVTIGAVALVGTLPQAIMAVRHPGSDRGAVRWGLDFFDVQGLGADLLEVLVGIHGLFTWTPLALVGFVGLVLATARPKGDRFPMLPALVVVIALVLLCAMARDPAAGHAFGARRLAATAGPLALGLVALRARASPSAARVLDLAMLVLAAANLVVAWLAIDGDVSLAP
jgi:hypothetical protein